MATDPESLGLSEWPDIEPLFDKAINSPANVTQEEKHKIVEWIPSRDEMEARTRKYLNRSLDDLFHTAAMDRDSLTYAECLMINQGFHLLRQLDHVGCEIARMRRTRLYPDLQAKWERAKAAVLPELEFRATINATDPLFFGDKQDEYFPRHRQLPKSEKRPAPWIQKIIDQGDDKSWGYVIYCSSLDDSHDWETFRINFQKAISDVPWRGPGSDLIRPTKVADLLNFDGPEGALNRLRENFRTLRAQGGLKPGVLSHVFLYVTPECRNSWTGAFITWLWAVDPDWPLDGPDEEGYDGRVPVNWTVCYDQLYNFMSMGKFSLKDIWRDFHHMRQNSVDKSRPPPGWAMSKLDKPPKPTWPDF
ncbi:hypothetical protein BJX61DRAFT_543045 [Aspergillus egyptiacus]|nr:hypothetical protein BJX61DRAFT_543045 [Aspergillus egyptiacus]